MEPTNRSLGYRESAAYGQACVSCSRAKCKCITRGVGTSCERCHRLRRECLPSVPVRKRNVRRTPSKTAKLEHKLDDLVTLLRSQTSGSSPDSQLEHNTAPEASRNARLVFRDVQHHGAAPKTAVRAHEDVSAPVASTVPSGPPPVLGLPSPCLTVSPSASTLSQSEAEKHLQLFRDVHLHALPYIHIPPGMTASEMQLERPFLWLNIRAICCKSASEKVELDARILKILAQKLIVESERSMDLLLGTLAVIAWGLDRDCKPRLGLLSGLAMSLVSDLRLDKNPDDNFCKESNMYKAFSHPIRAPTTSSSARSKEEHRALLACYLIGSNISAMLKSVPMRWNSYMEDCLQHLSSEPETPGDVRLAALVRICKIDEDINTTHGLRNIKSATTESPTTPPIMYVKALRQNLAEVKKMFGPDVLEDKFVLSSLHSTEATINALPLYSHATTKETTGFIDFGRVACVQASLHAAKQCLDNWFTFTPLEIYGLPMLPYQHFVRCTHIVYRMSVTDDPAWDRSAVQESINILEILEQVSERIGRIPDEVGLETVGGDSFSKTVVGLRTTIPIWRRAIEQGNPFPSEDATDGKCRPTTATPNDVAEPDNLVPIDFSDDAWMTDMFSSWETY